ncbi:uncharacterized protein LOC111019025 [Momordica charantia]|uniref:Uncharacterized protein LOC111019025 n=1 Tax=Momordica charantia TaxID=3673 RepID=A0A6J1DA14_MOMCH|nr:uncharacterized protein LOC111019025 [Momordica charantia]
MDGIVRHPTDSPSWRLIDHIWPNFGSKPRNLCLGLSTDGVNPYDERSSTYSCWLVITTIYNLPPWLCMRRKFLMLTMLISGPNQPGYDINTYLAPLVDDLKLMWEYGVECFDAYRQENFILKAVLMWTLNDFPAYGNLCGCSVKGYKACPICGENTTSIRLAHGKKNAYMGHIRFLPRHHPYRKQKKTFDGKKEFRVAPTPLSGEDIFGILNEIGFPNKYWKRRSIFFYLLYWKKLHVRHCLDVMHIEKNVCMNIVGTLLDISRKNKDIINARLDLIDMNIRPELAPQFRGKRTYLPPARYTLSKEKKQCFYTTLSKIKVPEGYSLNISTLVSVDDVKLKGLKSHDCHVLMQQLLPVVLRSVLPKDVCYAITRFCFFFNRVCSKELNVSELDQLQDDVVVTLCQLEKYFPPFFFIVMVHLIIHIVREIKLCGPIYLRWMYPFERYMKVLKGYVHNRTQPKGSIAQAYIVEEAVEFCTEFLSRLAPVGLGSL